MKLGNVYYAGSHGMDIMLPASPGKQCDGKYQNIANVENKVSCLLLFTHENRGRVCFDL